MIDVVGISFKENGHVYYFSPNNLVLSENTHVIVKTEHGIQYAYVRKSNFKLNDNQLVTPLKSIIRIADREDLKKHTKNIKDAKTLANLMIEIGKNNNKEVVCIIIDMNQPLGNSIGNSLEVIESIQVLKNEGPKDVKELVLKLGSYMVSLAKNISLKEAKNLLEENLKNDNAYNKFKEFVKTQGGNIENIKVAPKVFSVKSIKSGYVTEIDTQKLGEIVKLIGGGRTKKEDKINYGVGIVLSKKIGDYVNKDEEILKIYLDDKDMSIKEILDCFKITDKKVKTKLIKEIIL